MCYERRGLVHSRRFSNKKTAEFGCWLLRDFASDADRRHVTVNWPGMTLHASEPPPAALNIESSLVYQLLSDPGLEDELFSVLRGADSIVLFGAGCDEMGIPNAHTRLRCDAEIALKRRLPNYRYTIVSGGRRGVAAYSSVDPKATEAVQMIKYCVTSGENPGDYFAEPLAIETIGNFVFSTQPLLLHGLTRPVFVSQWFHLTRIRHAVVRWFWNSPIKPEFWPVKEPNLDRAMRDYMKQAADAFLDDGKGLGHVDAFIREVPGLDSAGNTRALEAAVRWLFEKDSRYREEYGPEDEFLARTL